MSTSTRTAPVTRTEFNALKRDVNKILALLDPAAPAKPARKAPAKKAPARKAQPKAAVTAKCLTRKNRAEFVKAHPWAAGLSTSVIAHMAVDEPALLAKGWKIGERRTAMVQG
jgi:hypothetical protein